MGPGAAPGRPEPVAGAAGAAAAGQQPEVAGAGFGQVAVLSPGPAGARLLAGRAGGRLRQVLTLPGDGPAALAHAYLGDVAAAVVNGGRIELAVVRYFRHAPGPVVSFGVPGAPVTALGLALDFRSEVLVTWQQGRSLYARLMRNDGTLGALQRIGPSAAAPALQAVLSDNGHAMLAWATAARGGRDSAVRIAMTDAHTRFGAPRAVATFPDPRGLARHAGALGLVRLSGENVLLAWTVRERGAYRVLAAPAVFAGVHPSTALSPAGRDATLEATAPGPADDALALWREGGALSECTLLVGRGDVVLPCAPRPVPAAIAPGAVAAAVEPASDRPVLAWGDRAVAPAGVHYLAGAALRPYVAHGYSPPAVAAPAARPAGGSHWLRIAVAAVAALALCTGLVLAARRRRDRGS